MGRLRRELIRQGGLLAESQRILAVTRSAEIGNTSMRALAAQLEDARLDLANVQKLKSQADNRIDVCAGVM